MQEVDRPGLCKTGSTKPSYDGVAVQFEH